MSRKIYTYGTQAAVRNLTVADIVAARQEGRRLVQTNAFSAEEAAAAQAAGMDMLVCRTERYDEVRAGAPETFITAVLLMSSFQTTDDIVGGAVSFAGRGADSVMTPRSPAMVEQIAREGIAVQGHVGLVPSLSTRLGGLRLIGKTADEAMQVLDHMRRLEEAGAFGCEVECVAADALSMIRKHTSLVLSSIGSGAQADVIFLFMSDRRHRGSATPRPRLGRSAQPASADGCRTAESLARISQRCPLRPIPGRVRIRLHGDGRAREACRTAGPTHSASPLNR